MDRTFIMEWLTIIVLSGTMLGVLCKYFIVEPLMSSIKSLKAMLSQAQSMLKQLKEEQHDLERKHYALDTRLSVIEKDVKNIYYQIDELKE